MNVVDWYGFKIFECNQPASRPGVYVITHIASGARYVGMSYDVARRVLQHLTASSGTSRLGRSIRADGSAAFLVTPVFYSMVGVDGLELIEAQLISALDSIRNGYNVIAASRRAGPYGAQFGELVKKGQATPAAKQRRAEILASPIEAAKRGKAIRAAHARPEVKAKLKLRRRGNGTAASLTPRARAKRLATEASPETKARRSAAIKAMHSLPKNKDNHLRACREANANPIRNAKIAAARRGRIWITDGTSDRAIHSSDSIPEGWRRGTRNRNVKIKY